MHYVYKAPHADDSNRQDNAMKIEIEYCGQ